MFRESTLTTLRRHHLMHQMQTPFLRALLALAILPFLSGCALLFPQAPTEIRNTRIQVDSGQTYFGGPLNGR
jgi:hypothetical protein